MGKNFKLDDRVWRKLEKKLSKMASLSVDIGVLSQEEVEGGGISIAELAAIHEFGAPNANIDERSFIRSTIEIDKRDISKMIENLAKAIIVRNFKVKRSLGILGEFVKGRIKKRIKSNIPPPLKPATILAKGSATALIDTGQLINSIQWKIV